MVSLGREKSWMRAPGGVVVEDGAYGDFEGGVFACGAGAVGAEAVAAALGLVLGVEAEVD